MAEFALVLGGTRSGKSEIAERLAVDLAARNRRELVYLATCRPGDEELLRRVEKHRARRGTEWRTIEETQDPARVLAEPSTRPRVVLLECVSFLIFNWMEDGDDDAAIMERIETLIAAARAADHAFIAVSNDVSGALIPADASTRRYQELVGLANQHFAAAADRVILAIAGLPLLIKSPVA